jgi:L-methionine (R)-S-oxide reductase
MTENNTLDKLKNILAKDLLRTTKAEQIAHSIREDGAYRWVGVYDVDLDRGLVSNIAWSEPAAPAYLTFPVTKGLTSRAIAEKKTINVGDVASDPGYLIALHTTRSEIIIPVVDVAGERVIGTLDVESQRPHAFGPESQTALEEIVRILVPFWIDGK